MNKELKKIIKELDGNILGIGLDKKIEKEIEKNNNIINCNFLNENVEKSKAKFNLFSKKIKINKIRKKFKKKKIDYIICNYSVISKYMNTFVKDSIYINNKKIFFYNGDLEFIESKYSRYNSKIKHDKKIIVVDNENIKTGFFKDNYYRFIDFKDKIIEMIGNVLMG